LSAAVTEKRRRFRALLASGPIVLAPGCDEAITARLAERAGCVAVHASGSVFHRVQGYADVGLLTLTEMVARTTAMAEAVNVPVIADGEEGFGGNLNVARTMVEFERAGAAAIHIEDSPAVSREEFVDKIRTAIAARTDPDFLIVARSQLPDDFDEMKARLTLCLEAGADLFWLALRDPGKIRAMCANFPGKPGIGVLPAGMTAGEYEACGARCALIPGALMVAGLHAQAELLKDMLASGTPETYLSRQNGIKATAEFYNRQGET
jgi:2-methylisocitrate lyase-like PEP mutase family enzyme